jgi:hypothetical protein
MKQSVPMLTCMAVFALLLSGCGGTPISPSNPLMDNNSRVIRQNEVDGQEDIQEFDINNCDGKAEATRIEHRTSSVDVTVSTELAAKIGASAEVISAEIQASVGAALNIGGERGTAIELRAPPNTHMFFQLAWIGKSQVGVIENVQGSGIPVAFQSFTPNDVRIKSQYDIGCRTSAPEPTAQSFPQAASSTSDPNPGLPIVDVTPLSPFSGLFVCGGPAFNNNLQTSNPLFLRPEGYTSGWISSDPSTIVLSDGTTKVIPTQYVLIVENLASVQVKGVQRFAGKANTTGCWYSADLSTSITEDAKTDFCKKKAGGSVAVMYRVSSAGLEELATTASISCP